MTREPGAVLRKALVRAEQLALRNAAQRTGLRRGAAAMADHATTFLATNAAAAEGGDQQAQADHVRAAHERSRARQLAAERDA